MLLDLSATFDTIDHNILVKKLENYVGIRESALAWFKSYLSDHHQFMAVNEEVSYQSQVQYGVPQGSVLGPLLFKSSQVTFIYIALLTIQIVTKHCTISDFLLLNSEKIEVLITVHASV